MNEIAAALIFGSGSGGTVKKDKNCGYVYKGGSFPTSKKDGSALENEDYVIASGNKDDFPFDIGSVTFEAPLQKAYYDAHTKIWMTDPGAIVDTSEVNVKTMATESYKGDATTQRDVNIETTESLKEIIKLGVNDLDTIVSPERRPYYQKKATTKRIAGLYWYNTDSTNSDKWESLGGNSQLKFTFTNTNTWSISHKLNKIPTIKCLDSDGNEIFGAITYPTANNATIEFAENRTGIAYVN